MASHNYAQEREAILPRHFKTTTRQSSNGIPHISATVV
jgi:hypothetical protein